MATAIKLLKVAIKCDRVTEIYSETAKLQPGLVYEEQRRIKYKKQTNKQPNKQCKALIYASNWAGNHTLSI